ncbi:MAG: hypothetical protein ACRED9_09665 [Caulobacteraceae bacterium]
MGKAGLRRSVALAGALVFAACAAPPAGPVRTAAPTPAVRSLPEEAAAPLPIPPPPAPRPDQCGARTLQGLVGKPEVDIPVPLEPETRRVLCTVCPRIGGYQPGRLTILYDPSSGLVTSVACG